MPNDSNAPTKPVEALISINNQLRQPEAAVGVLTVAQRTLNVDLKVAQTSGKPGVGITVHSCDAFDFRMGSSEY